MLLFIKLDQRVMTVTTQIVPTSVQHVVIISIDDLIVRADVVIVE